MNSKIVLKYVGQGAALIGVPAQDLTLTMIEESGYSVEKLVATGLYVTVAKDKPAPTENKSQVGGSDTK